MGVTGVALATLISQAASAISCMVFAIHKNQYFRLSRDEMKPHRRIIIMSVKLGIPIALQNSLISISMITLQSAVNTFGANVMAAYTIAGRVDSLVHQPFQSLSNAMSTYTGLGMIYIPRGLLNGAGDTGFSMINGICEVVVRITAVLLLTQTALGYWGVWWSNGITWTITGIVYLIRYWSGVWKKKAVV